MHNADMYYATHFLAVDPFIYLRVPHEGKDILVVSQMEYERARKESMVTEIRSSLDYGSDLKTEEFITKILLEERINAIEVPRNFPLFTAEELRKNGIEVVPVEQVMMTKERATKDEPEISYMKKAQYWGFLL
ncbi:MAG: aminopeptidase P family N-terminal domain-containing protein [Euryarchaeota archaeon]|nr:aminopeptidase P family N-terminal domain-containing protein [Euryarchaeota archaeon]